MEYIELRDKLLKRYDQFFKDMGIDPQTGIVKDTSKRFTGYPYIGHPLAELNQCVFNSANRFVIDIIEVLSDGLRTDFADNTGKQAIGLFCVISHNHILIS